MPTSRVSRRNFRQYDRDNGQAGIIAPSALGWQPSAQAVAANAGRISRFVPSRNMTITNIAYAVTAFTLGDTADPPVDVGIYSAALSRIVSSGATTGKLNSTGVKQVNITATTLQARTVYYVGLSVGAIGTTTASVMGATFAAVTATQLFGATAGLVEMDAASTVHPLPATWTLGTASSVAFVLALRES